MKKKYLFLTLTGLVSLNFIGCGASASNRDVDVVIVDESSEPSDNVDNSNEEDDNSEAPIKRNGTIVEEKFPPEKDGTLYHSTSFMNIENIYRVKVSKEGEPTDIRIFFDTNLYKDPEHTETLKKRIDSGRHALNDSIISHEESATEIYPLNEEPYSNNSYDIPEPASTEFIKRSVNYIKDKGFQSSMGNGFVLQEEEDDRYLAEFYIKESDITDISIDEYVKIRYNNILEEYDPVNEFNFTQVDNVLVKYKNVKTDENGDVICEIEVTNNSNKDMEDDIHFYFNYYRPGKGIDYDTDVSGSYSLKAGETKTITHTLYPLKGHSEQLDPSEIIVKVVLGSLKGPNNLRYNEECIIKIK
ncbi:MAG: hypothetical protein E6623_01725 [Clostridium perfringens]|uniref:hypothetical protein n=1 Tax=Clostridium perfringens TaxID=1502 RepID=UPI000D7113BF|nr:hypothetical protein [Clostridium perfringens]MBI6012484.1 hypothetical protein [Clostridium perfringens]MBO3319817.1 hypothetical protein [Clostridium perfringens]MDK0837612.1 hypothetical protein [Clostridium perfringens]MDM0995133.1 hypothetical protein [Clostridium perfringens]MDU6260320.1 hypothetical protein [Clostridium perfringens]